MCPPGPRILILQSDITLEAVDAIINAANCSLLGGGGVDGAIHFAAGPALLEECRTLGGCPTGEARLTLGHRLPARHVLHTVGPIWCGGGHDEDTLLACCYRACFALALRHGLHTLAFSAISTGVFGFPLERATRIALRETHAVLEQEAGIEQVRFVCFNSAAFDCYRQIFNETPHSPELCTSRT